jgi:hypothetical protein
VARFRLADAVDRGGDCCRFTPLRVLVSDERVLGMLCVCNVAVWWVGVVVDVVVER